MCWARTLVDGDFSSYFLWSFLYASTILTPVLEVCVCIPTTATVTESSNCWRRSLTLTITGLLEEEGEGEGEEEPALLLAGKSEIDRNVELTGDRFVQQPQTGRSSQESGSKAVFTPSLGVMHSPPTMSLLIVTLHSLLMLDPLHSFFWSPKRNKSQKTNNKKEQNAHVNLHSKQKIKTGLHYSFQTLLWPWKWVKVT